MATIQLEVRIHERQKKKAKFAVDPLQIWPV